MSTTFGRPSRAATDSPLYYQPPPRRSRWLLILLPVLAIFIGFGSIVWFAYVEGAPASAVGEPPLIKADARPIKLKPDDPGGQAIPDRGELGEMLADEAPGGPERLLPPPEEPLVPPPEAPAQPSATDLAAAADNLEREVESETLPPPEGGSSTTARTTPEPPRPAEASGSGATTAPLLSDDPPAASAAAIGSLFQSDQEPGQGSAPGAAAGAAATPPPAPAIETRPAGATRTASTDASSAAAEREAELARSRERAATIRPGSPDQLGRPAVARDEPEVAARPAPATVPNPVAQPSAEASVDGPHYRIQLAAVRNESDARRAWDLFQLDLGDVLSGIDPIIERGETSNGVFYRVQLGPYASLTKAETLCEELKRRNASCFVLRR